MAKQDTKAKPAAKNTKAADIDDLLGDGAPATKSKAKPAAESKAKPAKKTNPAGTDDDLLGGKPSAKTKPTAEAEDKPKRKRERTPVEFEDGEKESLVKSVTKLVAKGAQNSRDIATRLEIPTRKLRQVLYSMKRAGTVDLELAGSRNQGMIVTAAEAVEAKPAAKGKPAKK